MIIDDFEDLSLINKKLSDETEVGIPVLFGISDEEIHEELSQLNGYVEFSRNDLEI